VLAQEQPNKQLLGIPWRVAFALQADGWYLRQDIIWHKPNPMPESVTDRCTKAHEYIFMLTKCERYYYDYEAVKEDSKTWTGRAATFDRSGNAVSKHVIPGQSAAQHRPRKKQDDLGKATYTGFNGRYDFDNPNPKRNRRSVWNVATKPYRGAHFATYPPALIEPCILAGSKMGDVVFDPFGGSGTTAAVAIKHGRKAVLCELNPDYISLIKTRTAESLNDEL
jgi:DNA modification methylase